VPLYEVCGDVFSGCSGRVNNGVVGIGDRFRVELAEPHDEVFGRRRVILFSKINHPEVDESGV
jgi:hypothetical protein